MLWIICCWLASRRRKGGSRLLKHALATLADGIESLLKARLEAYDWCLIFKDVDKAERTKFESGDFQSVTFDQAIKRLTNICSVNFDHASFPVLESLRQLRKQPQFYNTLANNCITNIIRHLEEVSRQIVSFDLRVLFPGYADELAVELDLINFSGSLDEARERFRINDRSGFIDDGREWSRQIRQVQ